MLCDICNHILFLCVKYWEKISSLISCSVKNNATERYVFMRWKQNRNHTKGKFMAWCHCWQCDEVLFQKSEVSCFSWTDQTLSKLFQIGLLYSISEERVSYNFQLFSYMFPCKVSCPTCLPSYERNEAHNKYLAQHYCVRWEYWECFSM